MKTIAVHSHKGGVGKTTVALLLAKHATTSGQKVCVVDFDFIASGMADLFVLKKVPDSYLEDYFLCANPHGFHLQQLLGNYTDEDMELSIILNLKRGHLDKKDAKTHDYMMGLVADEPHYYEIQTKTRILLDKLEDHGVELTVIDCHPGLDFVSETIRPIADMNVYVTTPMRSDCFGLLKALKLKKLDEPKSFLIVNMAKGALVDLASFRKSMEEDSVVGTEAQTLFSYLKHVGQRVENFALIRESDVLRSIFYMGSPGYLPFYLFSSNNGEKRSHSVLPEEDTFSFCPKILSLVY